MDQSIIAAAYRGSWSVLCRMPPIQRMVLGCGRRGPPQARRDGAADESDDAQAQALKRYDREFDLALIAACGSQVLVDTPTRSSTTASHPIARPVFAALPSADHARCDRAFLARLHAVADDLAAAVRADGGARIDGALEAVERPRPAFLRQLEGLVVSRCRRCHIEPYPSPFSCIQSGEQGEARIDQAISECAPPSTEMSAIDLPTSLASSQRARSLTATMPDRTLVAVQNGRTGQLVVAHVVRPSWSSSSS